MKDLTTVETTYVAALIKKSAELKDSFDKETLEDYRTKILAAVSLAKKTPARESFIKDIIKLPSKTALCERVYSAILCGANLGLHRTAKAYK